MQPKASGFQFQVNHTTHDTLIREYVTDIARDVMTEVQFDIYSKLRGRLAAAHELYGPHILTSQVKQDDGFTELVRLYDAVPGVVKLECFVHLKHEMEHQFSLEQSTIADVRRICMEELCDDEKELPLSMCAQIVIVFEQLSKLGYRFSTGRVASPNAGIIISARHIRQGLHLPALEISHTFNPANRRP